MSSVKVSLQHAGSSTSCPVAELPIRGLSEDREGPRPTFAEDSESPRPTFAEDSESPRPTFAEDSESPRPTFAGRPTPVLGQAAARPSTGLQTPVLGRALQPGRRPGCRPRFSAGLQPDHGLCSPITGSAARSRALQPGRRPGCRPRFSAGLQTGLHTTGLDIMLYDIQIFHVLVTPGLR
ncbi:unnamed protein product [Boreogadus saida]